MKNDREKFKKESKDRIYRFILRLIKFVDELPKSRAGRIIGDQLLRSGTSMGANYVEAQATSSRRDFTNFFTHSLKSANESRFWIEILRDAKKADKKEANALLQELTEIANVLASSILTLKGKR